MFTKPIRNKFKNDEDFEGAQWQLNDLHVNFLGEEAFVRLNVIVNGKLYERCHIDLSDDLESLAKDVRKILKKKDEFKDYVED